MIFSIILIVVFITFAFYAIGKFLDIQKAAKTGQFIQAFKSDIDQMWRSSQGSQVVEYSLPSSVEQICFADFNSTKTGAKQSLYGDLKFVYFKDENLFFYPTGSAGAVDSTKINNIDLIEITSRENPYCITNLKGKVKMTIKKGLDEALVTVTR
ncbi:MAG: hypothetical protein AABY15_03645 [Nanoarchaeota archaeon]